MAQDLTGFAPAPTTGRVPRPPLRRIEVQEADLPFIIVFKGTEYVLNGTKNSKLNLQKPI